MEWVAPVAMMSGAGFAVYYIFRVLDPILGVVQSRSPEWVTWRDVKQESHQPTRKVVETLRKEAMNGGRLKCRLRPANELVRIEKLLKCRPTGATHPLTNRDVAFYEFWMPAGGGLRLRRPKLARLRAPAST